MILTILVRQRQQVAVAAVGMQMGRQNARRFRSPQHHRPCAIAKQNDGAAIFRIQRARQDVRADNQRMFDRAVFHILIGHAERVSKAGTGRSQIERRTVFDAQHLLHQARRARERVSGRGGRHDDQPNVFFSHTCHFQRFLSGLEAHRRDGFIRSGDATFADTGTRDDPLVRGIHHFFQISIGAHLYGQITPRTENLCIHVRSVTLR